VLNELSDIRLSVSCTTRRPRETEEDGRDYHFISDDEFQKSIDADRFLEWADVHGARYGTPKENITPLTDGTDIILEIDTTGARKLKEQHDTGVFIFIVPPSFEDLKRRLRGRGDDPETAVHARLEAARKELEQTGWYDYIVVNEDLDVAARQLMSIIMAERCRTSRVITTLRRDVWQGSQSKIA
jgi:guanylate kinase